MWKCIRCEKENSDLVENCSECGHAKSMDYVNYRTLSRIRASVMENWKADLATPEYFAKQGLEHLQKAAELMEKAGLCDDSVRTREVLRAVRDKLAVSEEKSEEWKAALQKLLIVCNTVNQKKVPVLIADNNKDYVLGSDIFRDKIKKIEFVKIDMDLVPRSAWDVSEDKDESVWAWVENIDNEKVLKIGSENGVRANPDCAGLFQNYINTREIGFHGLFDTSQVTTMKSMFEACFVLNKIDIDSFDTGNVTDMQQMFFSCSEIRNLDVSSFDTHHVTNMMHMFGWCGALTELDVNGFDTGRVKNMMGMFAGCKNLTEVNVSKFYIRYDVNVSFMFSDCENLTKLEMSNSLSRCVKETPNLLEGCWRLRL